MKKAELASLLGSGGMPVDMGTIEEHLHTVASAEELPDFAIAMCTARIEESAPLLRAVLARAADGEILSDDEKRLVFRGLHILGAARDTEAWPILLRLLRRPAEELEEVLGDGITQSLARIATGMFDGDTGPLFDTIAERSVEQYARAALFGAATYLTWEGRIERDQTQSFLQRFYDERMASEGDFAWVGWFESIALLGLRDLAPLYHRAWDEGQIDPDFLERENFEKDLARAEREPANAERFEFFCLGYIADVIDALEWTRTFDHTKELSHSSQQEADWFPNEPFINPWRNVGRNDPCPCGSGKKSEEMLPGQSV